MEISRAWREPSPAVLPFPARASEDPPEASVYGERKDQELDSSQPRLEFEPPLRSPRHPMPLPPFDSRGLLPEGIHLAATEAELHALCVAPFPRSASRPRIFQNFCRYRAAIAALGLHVNQWIDGSFLDQTRLDPEDIDVINFLSADQLRALPAPDRPAAFKLLRDAATDAPEYDTHSFLHITYAYDDLPWSAESEAKRKQQRDWFSRTQRYTLTSKKEALNRGRKGIVQMTIGDATLCPWVDPAP